GVAAGHGRLVHVTGQIAFDENREVVGRGDVIRQMCLCFDHIERILDGFGGRLGDVATLTVFYTDAGQLEQIREVWAEVFDRAGTAPACVMIQVAGLVHPDLLVELIPTAVIPEDRFREPKPA
ncbi:MAG: RidA family protein, partial [Geminicoccaceae bacterium]